MKLGLLKYSVGNIKSLISYFENLGFDIKVIESSKEFINFDSIILPGVGSFSSAVKFLNQNNFYDALHDHHRKKKKIIGICLGFQLFSKNSNENNQISEGLNFIDTRVYHLSELVNYESQRIPHIGWNFLNQDKNKPYYFLHSYGIPIEEIKKCDFDKLDYCDYQGIKIASLFENKNLLGIQFHPEKSCGSFDKELLKFLNK